MTQQCVGCAEAQEKAKKLDAIVEKYKDTRGALIQVLHEVQEVYGYLPLEVQRAISEKMNIPFIVADDPLHAVARGTGLALKNIDKYSFLMR